MKKKNVIISKSQLEKIRNILYNNFNDKLYPFYGWKEVAQNIRDGVDGWEEGETYVHYNDDDFYNYYSCKWVKDYELKGIKCPCLMLQDEDYEYFDKRFPPHLWKPVLIDWWNSKCEYPVKAVYKF